MEQKYYEVTVEALVQRTVTVTASNFSEAETKARQRGIGMLAPPELMMHQPEILPLDEP